MAKLKISKKDRPKIIVGIVVVFLLLLWFKVIPLRATPTNYMTSVVIDEISTNQFRVTRNSPFGVYQETITCEASNDPRYKFWTPCYIGNVYYWAEHEYAPRYTGSTDYLSVILNTKTQGQQKFTLRYVHRKHAGDCATCQPSANEADYVNVDSNEAGFTFLQTIGRGQGELECGGGWTKKRWGYTSSSLSIKDPSNPNHYWNGNYEWGSHTVEEHYVDINQPMTNYEDFIDSMFCGSTNNILWYNNPTTFMFGTEKRGAFYIRFTQSFAQAEQDAPIPTTPTPTVITTTTMTTTPTYITTTPTFITTTTNGGNGGVPDNTLLIIGALGAGIVGLYFWKFR